MKHTGLGIQAKQYVISLEKGDRVNESIEQFCIDHGIAHATFTGIGAITNIKVACYHIERKEYSYKDFEGEFELTSLVGNFGYIENGTDDDKHFAHTHVSFSDEEFNCRGGHLVEAEVLVVLEIYITAFEKPLIRKHDDITGLNTMQIKCGCKEGGGCACKHPLSR